MAAVSTLFPRLSAALYALSSRSASQLSLPLFPSVAIAVPGAISLNIPSLLEGIWESVLRAVPKKKTSHSKKRSRFLAGKGLQDLTNLNRCSACGALKRAHFLCPYCVKEIQEFFKRGGAKLDSTATTTTTKTGSASSSASA